ncbi:hypothetical protein [Streptomyces sp. NPDC051001]|uniref:hypothetical protein n=1 Tax=Streptomyces sp. NPDC051001 TaxID=3155795 RepID=UPI00341D47D5
MHVIAADPFWASGTFWAAAAVVVAVLVGIGAMWATLRAAHPKRRIAYDSEATAIVASNHPLGSTLEVRRNGILLTNPYIVRVDIKNTGRRDITSNEFDNASPLRFDLGVPILEVLNAESTPREAQLPAYEVSGRELHIKPSRIGKETIASYTVLVEGSPRPSLTHSLIDVQVTRGLQGGWEGRFDRWEDRIDNIHPVFQFLIFIAFVALILFGIGYFTDGAGLINLKIDVE